MGFNRRINLDHSVAHQTECWNTCYRTRFQSNMFVEKKMYLLINYFRFMYYIHIRKFVDCSFIVDRSDRSTKRARFLLLQQ